MEQQNNYNKGLVKQNISEFMVFRILVHISILAMIDSSKEKTFSLG
jgi:hypothetical protein